MSRKNNAFPIIATVFYSCIWFCMLFIIVGFFMPKPVAFYKKMNGTSQKRYAVKTSEYGLDDDPELDEEEFYDTMEEN